MRGTDPHVIGRNADTILDGTGEPPGELGRHHDDVDRDDRGLDRSLLEDDDTSGRRLSRTRDEPRIAGRAVESGEFDAVRRRGVDGCVSHEQVVGNCRTAKPARGSRCCESSPGQEQRAPGWPSTVLILSPRVSVHVAFFMQCHMVLTR